jgi:Flp pilus assembly protein TadD
MNKRLLLWALPCAVIAAAAILVYRAGRPEPAALGALAPIHSSELTQSASEQELDSLRRGLEENPSHVPILVRLAQVSRETGKTKESLEYLRQAVAADPKNREATLELGRALFEAGDVGAALRETSRLLEDDPSNVDALYNLGAIYGNLGQDERARDYWNKAVRIAPESESGRLAANGLKQLKPPG